MHIYSIYNQEKNNNWEKKNSSIKFAVVFGSFVYFLSFLLWTLLTFLASGQSVIFWVPIFGLDFLHEISVRYYFKEFYQSKISYAGKHMPRLAFGGQRITSQFLLSTMWAPVIIRTWQQVPSPVEPT